MDISAYLPVLLFIGIGAFVGIAPILIGSFLGPRRPDAQKLSAYECGFEVFEDARMQFDVRYYLIAVLFILFDLETALLFPWAANSKALGFEVFVAVMIFVVELIIGYVYIWKKGALDWE